MTAGIARQEVVGRFRSRRAGGSSLRDRRLQQAREFADRMSHLKGAAMKVGQQVAVLASQMDLPDDIQEALGTLHADAEPVPFPSIRATLQGEFDAPLDQLFDVIEPVPLGTASLAQAHAARLPEAARS